MKHMDKGAQQMYQLRGTKQICDKPAQHRGGWWF